MQNTRKGIHNLLSSNQQTAVKKYLFLILLFLAFACKDGEGLLSSRPSGVLSQDEMTDILVDIHLAESALRVGNIQHISNADSTYQKSQFLEIFREHEVSPDEFRNSVKYYTEHVTLLDAIYTEVINRLTEMEAGLQGDQNKKDNKAGKANEVSKPVKVTPGNPAQKPE